MRIRVPSLRSPRRRAPVVRQALLVMLGGTVPALLIASSARAASATPADGLAIGVLAAVFAAMLALLTLLARRIAGGLTAATHAPARTPSRMSGARRSGSKSGDAR